MDDECSILQLTLDDLLDTERIDVAKRGKGGTGVTDRFNSSIAYSMEDYSLSVASEPSASSVAEDETSVQLIFTPTDSAASSMDLRDLILERPTP